MECNERSPLINAKDRDVGRTPAHPDLENLDVYGSIHRVYRDLRDWVDVPLSDEQMRSPEIQFAIIQPLEAQLAELNDPSIVYVLLLVRLQFLRERDSFLSSSSLNETRAHLSELLAIKLLRHQATTAKGPNAGLLAMSRALVGGLHAFQGAKKDVLGRVKQREGYASRTVEQGAGKTNALELAILGKARMFIKSQATQRVINAIWEGKVVYSSSSFINVLPDRWKIQQINVYNVKDAPILDHYRLRVPKYRALIDTGSFLILFLSFLAVIIDHHKRDDSLPVAALSLHEKWFFFYALGFSLDKLASITEHGWSVYAAGLTNGLDMMAIPIFLGSFIFRIHSVRTNEEWAANQAYDLLSCAACLMFPRLAFATVSNNLLILSLRAMLADFAWLMGIAVFCFLGFVFALSHLCDGQYSVSRIAEWLIFIWFGLDGSGLDASPEFHPILGPMLITVYAALSNTLLVSLLVAILSGTYASIAADAAAEDMFRKAVMTFEGVKSDSLFDYVPPLNLVALCVMWPISFLSSPRWFHKINVATCRVLSLPILLLIALYERQSKIDSPIRAWWSDLWVKVASALPTRWTQRLSLLEGAHWECEAVFEYTPSGDEDESDDEQLEEEMSADEVETATQDPECQRRLNARASKIIASPRNVSTPQPMGSGPDSFPFVNLPSAAMASPALSRASSTVQLAPPSQGTRPGVRFENYQSATQPSTPKAKPRLTVQHEHQPSNAQGHRAAHTQSPPPIEAYLESALSTSPGPASGPARFESPLSKLYHHQEGNLGGATGMSGIKRRLSMGHPVRSNTIAVPSERLTVVDPVATIAHPESAAQIRELTEMVRALQVSLMRLEQKLGHNAST